MAAKPTAGSKSAPRMKRPRGTGASSVYEHLRLEILNLEIEPGTLLDETELSRRYDISRSPIREALIRLSAEGLVKTLRNRSSIVAFLDISEIFGYFDALDLMYRVTARRAAEVASPEAIARIKAAGLAHSDAIKCGDVMQMISTNHAFHLSIARASGNPFYESWTKMLLDNGQRIMRLYMRHLGDRPESRAEGEHPNIIRAIEHHDASGAEAAAKRDAAITSAQVLSAITDRNMGEIQLGPDVVSRYKAANSQK
jgi:DNA-binding GntR family transcriptional regulator